MTLYEFRCPFGEPIERMYPLGEAPETITCEDHNSPAPRSLARPTTPAFPGSHNATYRSKKHAPTAG